MDKIKKSDHSEKPVVDKEIFADAKALFLIASNVNAPVPAMTALLWWITLFHGNTLESIQDLSFKYFETELKVNKFRKQISLFSFESENERNYFLIFALASKNGSNQKMLCCDESPFSTEIL